MLKAIETTLTGTGRPYFYPVTANVHRGGLEYRFHIGEVPPFDSESYALIAGDCLFNLRAALDHVVYQLHVRRYLGSVPDEIASRSAFPILDLRPDGKKGRAIDSTKRNEIGSLSIKHRRAIEFLQPYNTRKDRLQSERWVLGQVNDLNRIDKHRHLHLALARVTAVPAPNFPPEYGFVATPFFDPLKSHAEVFRWAFAIRPEGDVAAKMKLKYTVGAGVCLYEGRGYTEFTPLLQTCVRRIRDVLTRFDRFFD